MNQFIANKQINPDKKFFNFMMRTRSHYYDDKIIRQCLDEEKDVYKMPRELKTVIDIGANIGCISLIATSRGAEVYAFEPESFNFETLEHNIKINNLIDKIIPIKKGVGIANKETKLYVHPDACGTTSSFLTQKGLEEDKYQIVEFISIKDVFNNYNIEYCDFLKLDCEGGEDDIIRDLTDELAGKIGQISVEFHNKKTVSEMINILSKWFIPEHLRRYEWTFLKKI